MAQYLPILTMIVLVLIFVAASFIASKLLTTKRPTKAKTAPYECGIVSEDEPAERFPVRFYLVALAFIVLDVEIIFLYPFATIFRRARRLRPRRRWASFLLVLIVPFAYLLSVGALDWGPMRQVVGRVLGPVLRTTTVPSGIPAADDAASEDEAA